MSRTQGFGLFLVSLAVVGAWYFKVTHRKPAEATASPTIEVPSKGDLRPPGDPAVAEVSLQRAPMLAETPSLKGHVYSREGSPLEDAQVLWLALEEQDTKPWSSWAVDAWGRPDRKTTRTVSTPDGSFEFILKPVPELPFGSLLIVVHRQHFPGIFQLDFDSSKWPAETIFRLDPATPLEVEVVDDFGKAVEHATVHHVAKRTTTTENTDSFDTAFTSLVAEEASTDALGRVQLAPFRGQQVLWAEKDSLVSIPWQGGPHTGKVRLVLGDSFTVGGTITLPRTRSNQETVGKQSLFVFGQEGSLWRPLASLRDVESRTWGPLLLPTGNFSDYRIRLEGPPIVPLEEKLGKVLAGSHRRVDFVAEIQADVDFIVQDESGRPITNATAILWWGPDDQPTGPRYIYGSAAPDGHIRIGTFPPGWISFRIGAPGYAFREEMVEAPTIHTVTLVRGGAISGRCMHEGMPVKDFQVVYWQEGIVRTYRTASFFDREDGTFAVESLLPGSWSIHAASTSFPSGRPVSLEVTADAETHVELELPTAITGGGRVVDAATDEPVVGARVQVYSSAGMGRSLPWGIPVETAADGTFLVDAFILGANYVTVEADGYANSQTMATARDDSFLDFGDIRLLLPQTLTVSLEGLEELVGLEANDLRASAEKSFRLPQQYFSSDGLLRYEGVPPGDYQLFLDYPDASWTRLHLRLDPGKEWNFALKIAGERKVDVRVTDSTGSPLDYPVGVAVTAQEESGILVVRWRQTLRNGNATFEGLQATRAQVFILSPDNETLANKDIDFGRDSSLQVEIKVGDKPFRIHVLDADRKPLPGAWITIRSASGVEIQGVDDTDAGGWAELLGLPAGPLLMDVSHGLAGKRLGVPVEASAEELEFVLEAEGALELRIVDGDLPLAGVAARIETTGGVTLSDAKQTDDQGIVRFEPLGEGSYHLGCRRADCWPAVVDEQLGPGEHARVTVQMRPLGDLELTVLSRDGLPVTDVPVSLTSKEFGAAVETWVAEDRVRAPEGLATGRRGTVRIEGLPRGRYSWSVDTPDGPMTGSFELEPAKANQVRIVLP